MDAERAYRRYFPLVLQHARRMLGSGVHAQDIAQETFIRFLNARVDGTDATVVAWLYRTSANLTIDWLRGQKRAPLDTAIAVEVSAPETLDSGVALRRMVTQLSQRLSADVLRAGILSRANGLTQLELAQLLAVSDRTVRRWLTDFDDAVRALHEEAT